MGNCRSEKSRNRILENKKRSDSFFNALQIEFIQKHLFSDDFPRLLMLESMYKSRDASGQPSVFFIITEGKIGTVPL